MLRILFSRLGQPHIGSPKAFSFNVASISEAGAVTLERGGRTVKERRAFSITGGMCPRCEGRGTVTDIDLTQVFDDAKSLNQGAITFPGYKSGGWNSRLYIERGSSTRTSQSASTAGSNCMTSSVTNRPG